MFSTEIFTKFRHTLGLPLEENIVLELAEREHGALSNRRITSNVYKANYFQNE